MSLLLLTCLASFQEDLGALVDRLGHDDPAARDEAAIRLVELGEKAWPPLRKRLETAGAEDGARIRGILESPYSGLDRKAAGAIRLQEERHAELIRLLQKKDGQGLHGSFHELQEDLEKELWGLIDKLPRYPGAARLILAAIDEVYLKVHDNGYHGWTWHHPYFNCSKAVALADRLIRDHPPAAEEALWTKLYCFRLRGLGEKDLQNYEIAAAKAQKAWRPDAAQARAAAKELAERFPKGPYAGRAADCLQLSDDALILPPIRGYAHPFSRGLKRD